MKSTQTYGPDRATFKHWLDREEKAVIGIADCLKTARRRFGSPCSITRKPEQTVYVWQSGFDRFAFIVHRSAKLA